MKPVFIVAIVAVVMIGMMIPNISAQDFSDKTSEPSFFSNIFKFFDSWFPENNSKSNLKSTDTSSNISAEEFLVDSYITKPTFKVKSEAAADARVEQEYKAQARVEVKADKAAMHEVIMAKIAADRAIDNDAAYKAEDRKKDIEKDYASCRKYASSYSECDYVKLEAELFEKNLVSSLAADKAAADRAYESTKIGLSPSKLVAYEFVYQKAERERYEDEVKERDFYSNKYLAVNYEDYEDYKKSTAMYEKSVRDREIEIKALYKTFEEAERVTASDQYKKLPVSIEPKYNPQVVTKYNPSVEPKYNPSVEPKNANPLGTMSIDRSPHFSSFPEITKKNLNSPSFNVGNFDQPSLPPSLPPVYDSPRTPEPAYNPAKEAARSGIGQNSQPAYSAPSVPNPFEK